jgi:hypothetical protein
MLALTMIEDMGWSPRRRPLSAQGTQRSLALFMSSLEQANELGQHGGHMESLAFINPDGGQSSFLAAARKQQLVKTSEESSRFQLIGTQFLDECRQKRRLCLTGRR